MLTVIVFTNDNKEIPPFPQRKGLEFQHVDFNSSALDDLMLVAKYRILQYPTSLVTDHNKRVLMRMKGIITEPFLNDLFKV